MTAELRRDFLRLVKLSHFTISASGGGVHTTNSLIDSGLLQFKKCGKRCVLSISNLIGYKMVHAGTYPLLNWGVRNCV